jgi:hypothetical protein
MVESDISLSHSYQFTIDGDIFVPFKKEFYGHVFCKSKTE